MGANKEGVQWPDERVVWREVSIATACGDSGHPSVDVVTVAGVEWRKGQFCEVAGIEGDFCIRHFEIMPDQQVRTMMRGASSIGVSPLWLRPEHGVYCTRLRVECGIDLAVDEDEDEDEDGDAVFKPKIEIISRLLTYRNGLIVKTEECFEGVGYDLIGAGDALKRLDARCGPSLKKLRDIKGDHFWFGERFTLDFREYDVASDLPVLTEDVVGILAEGQGK